MTQERSSNPTPQRFDKIVTQAELLLLWNETGIVPNTNSPLANLFRDSPPASAEPKRPATQDSPAASCLKILAGPAALYVWRSILPGESGETVYYADADGTLVGFWPTDANRFVIRGPLDASELIADIRRIIPPAAETPIPAGARLFTGQMTLLFCIVDKLRTIQLDALRNGSLTVEPRIPRNELAPGDQPDDPRRLPVCLPKLLPDGLWKFPDALDEALAGLASTGLIALANGEIKPSAALLELAIDFIDPLPAVSLLSTRFGVPKSAQCSILLRARSLWLLEALGTDELGLTTISHRAVIDHLARRFERPADSPTPPVKTPAPPVPPSAPPLDVKSQPGRIAAFLFAALALLGGAILLDLRESPTWDSTSTPSAQPSPADKPPPGRVAATSAPSSSPTLEKKPPPAPAGPRLKLEGKSAWKTDDTTGTVRVSFAKLINEGDRESGELQIELWATSSKYERGIPEGHLLATLPLTPLKPGEGYKDLDQETKYSPPPNGKFHTVLILREKIGDTQRVAAHVSFDGLSTFQRKEVALIGEFSFETKPDENKIHIEIQEIRNQRPGTATGTLRLQLWLTPQPWNKTGKSQSGYVVMEQQLKPLETGQSYKDIDTWLAYSRPPAGKYYFTLTIEEYTDDAYVRRDNVIIEKPLQAY